MKIKFTFLPFFIFFSFIGSAQWSLENLPIARSGAGAIEYENKIYFIGGRNFDLDFADWTLANNRIDIFDPATGIFDSLFIPVQREFSIAESYNDKLYITGPNNELSVYDFLDESWSSTNLIGLGDVYRMARLDNWLLMSNQFGSLNLLNLDTEELIAIDMPEKTFLVAMTSCAGKFILAGGGLPFDNTDLVQIYDPFTDSWTTSALSESKANLQGTCYNDLAYFAGGETETGEYTNKVEIYDVVQDIWVLDELPSGRDELTIQSTDKGVYISGGYNFNLDPVYPNESFIYSSPTDFQTITLPEGRIQIGIFGFQDKAYFYGGAEINKKNYVSRIDILDEKLVNIEEHVINEFNVFPNPASTYIEVSENITKDLENSIFSIISADGSTVMKGMLDNRITVENLPIGNYRVIINYQNELYRSSFIKI